MRIADAVGRPPRALLLDIETSPHVAHVWTAKPEYIGAEFIERNGQVLCFAAKWIGEPTILFERCRNPSSASGDKAVVSAAWKLFDAADIVVAHNGRAFDERYLKARWARWQMPPPAPYKMVDTCLLARHGFNFPHNSLNGLARYLGVGQKVEHEGFGLWLRCMAGDAAAWARMERYNINDVVLLESVYMRLRAWDKRHPNVGAIYEDGLPRCVVCGSAALRAIGKPARTSACQYDALRCRSCGKVQRARKAHRTPAQVVNAL